MAAQRYRRWAGGKNPLTCGMALFSPELRTVHVARYIAPLREGGSLPALVEADDDFMYVLKFAGAGQGMKALIAELIGGELARLLGLRVPELVFATLEPAMSRTEADEEIQDLLRASDPHTNLGLHYLSRSITFDPVVNQPDPHLASQIVWLDALLVNMDRTARNTNMLLWQRELWLIDHGAALYFHHTGENWHLGSQRAFPQIKDHVLLPLASELERVDAEMHALLTSDHIRTIVNLVPESWLTGGSAFASAEEERERYVYFLTDRFSHSANFVKEAQDAR